MEERNGLPKSDSELQQYRDGEEYSFIRETIKEKPPNKKVILRRIAATLAAAVLFGVTAALVFALTYPMISARVQDNQELPRVDINVNQPEETPQPEEMSQPEESVEPTATPQVVEVPRNITLEDYERIYEEIRQVAEEPLKAMVTVAGVTDGENLLDKSYVSYGQSAGVIIARNSAEIYVLTSKSAMGGNAQIARVTFCDGAIAEGTLRKADDGTGLAVVAISMENVGKETRDAITVAELGNSYSLMQGKPVIAIGSPTGYNEAVVYGTITSVSNKVSLVDAQYNLLVTDILGSREGSGVLLDTGGSVIGVISQSFGESYDTMVKALAVSQLKSLLAALSNAEGIRYVGLYGQDVTETMAKQIGIPQGIYVDSVEAESPAMKAGIQSADIITGFKNEEVLTMQRFSTELQNCDGETVVPITLMRRGDGGYVEMQFQITIGVK